MVTLHCPRCHAAAAPGVTDLIIDCAKCGLSFTADDGARTAPPGEVTRVRSSEDPSDVTVDVRGDTVTIVARRPAISA